MSCVSKLKKVSFYCKKLYQKHLLLSNTLTTITILASGDMMSQYVERKMSQTPCLVSFDIGKSFLRSVFALNETNRSLLPSSREIIFSSDTKTISTKVSFFRDYDWARTGNFNSICKNCIQN